MEFTSLIILVIATMIVALRVGYLSFFSHPAIIKIGMWVLFI